MNMKLSPNYENFYENFLTDKKELSSSPSSEKSYFSGSKKNEVFTSNFVETKSITERSKTKPTTPKLLKYKRHVLRALKNKRNPSPIQSPTLQHTQDKSNSSSTDLNHLPPLLLNNVKMFLTKIRKTGYLNHLSTLKPLDLKILNDHSHFDVENQGNLSNKNKNILYLFLSSFVSFIEFFGSRNLQIPVIHPYNKFKLLWDIYMYIVTILLMFFIPFAIAFQSKIIEDYTLFFSCILLLDMVLEMNTLFFFYGTEVRNRRKIFINYLKSYFFPDLIALMSILFGSDKLMEDCFWKHMTLFFFLKMFTLLKVSKRLENRFQISYQWKGIKDLIILFLVLILITHITACGWFYVGNVSVSTLDEKNWIKAQSLIDQSWYIKYMSSFYWSSVTVMTVGYGDITPQNHIERFYCLCVVLFGCMVLPYAINSIGLIIQDINREQKRFEYK